MTPLSWPGILRLGLVQMALGAIVVLTTATMNRVMVVELALPAILPGLLVSLYYGTQFLRPRFGHGADRGGRRTPWIVGGVLVLAMGAIGAALSVWLMGSHVALGIAAAVFSFLLIGFGIGSAGTNVLALLAARVAEERRAPAGSAVWIMMIFGLALTGIAAGQVLDPYTPARLIAVTMGVSAIAVVLALIGVWRQEGAPAGPAAERGESAPFGTVLRRLWADREVRLFTLFIFASMLAYNLQDLILEPFAGHVFALTVGESTALGGMLHAGALAGMLVVLVSGTALARWVLVPIRVWIVGGCVVSGLALLALAFGAQMAPAWPIAPNVFVLGLANGVFAVAAIGAMMGFARQDARGSDTGLRMGLFGAAQAIAFGLGAFLGTAAADITRALMASDALAYGTVFAAEGVIFFLSAIVALRITAPTEVPRTIAAVPGE
ncbi:MAG: BCD family MFS transporter [Pseudomonadota bacterium]